jgi:hypothetical protein
LQLRHLLQRPLLSHLQHKKLPTQPMHSLM